jgi:hypothetical protein
MLIDIFARRYEDVKLRDVFEERDRRLLVQATRILREDVYPFPGGAKEGAPAHKFWSNLHDRLSRELGLTELTPRWVFYTTQWNGKDVRQNYENNPEQRCTKWALEPPSTDADRHIRERLSLIELGFRERESEIAVMNAEPILFRGMPTAFAIDQQSAKMCEEHTKRFRQEKTDAFGAAVEELNERFRQAAYGLHYHNGFIQLSTDQLVQQTIETPFWHLVADRRWSNVDMDMKEALDRRDGGGRDPALYAARALESAIKIICSWSNGKEKGAHNYIDQLGSKANAYVERWEAESLKNFFTHVRNPMGHGPGGAQMPSLSASQTEWAIEFSMAWTKNLIRRL